MLGGCSGYPKSKQNMGRSITTITIVLQQFTIIAIVSQQYFQLSQYYRNSQNLQSIVSTTRYTPNIPQHPATPPNMPPTPPLSAHRHPHHLLILLIYSLILLICSFTYLQLLLIQLLMFIQTDFKRIRQNVFINSSPGFSKQ